MQQLKLVEDNRQHLAVDLDQLLLAAEEQFLKRNISVVEFVDLYSSYRDTNFMMEDGKAQLFKSNEELKKNTHNENIYDDIGRTAACGSLWQERFAGRGREANHCHKER